MNLKTKLSYLAEDVKSNYPLINHGGCCVFASLVGSVLEERGIQVDGVVASWSAKRFNRRAKIDDVRPNIKRNCLQEWDRQGVYFSHVGLEITVDGVKKLYDANGLIPNRKRYLDGLPLYKGRISVTDLVRLARQRKEWNTAFNRRLIPKLREMVAYHLADI